MAKRSASLLQTKLTRSVAPSYMKQLFASENAGKVAPLMFRDTTLSSGNITRPLPPEVFTFITEAGDFLMTEAGDNLTTE